MRLTYVGCCCVHVCVRDRYLTEDPPSKHAGANDLHERHAHFWIRTSMSHCFNEHAVKFIGMWSAEGSPFRFTFVHVCVCAC